MKTPAKQHIRIKTIVAENKVFVVGKEVRIISQDRRKCGKKVL